MKALDLLRSSDHDLLCAELQEFYRDVSDGRCDIIICARLLPHAHLLLWSNSRGPRPVRGKDYPNGSLWLRGKARAEAEGAGA